MPIQIMNRFFVFSLLLGCLIALGCSSTTEPIGSEEFTIYVDSISAPDSIAWYEPFLVRVWAWVGPNLCHKFSDFELTWQQSELHVDVIGVRQTGPVACAAAESRIYGVGFAVNPPFPGEQFDLVFQGRGGGVLRHTVRRAQ